MRAILIVATLLLASMVSGSNVDLASTYEYPVSVDDPVGDHTGPNAVAGGPVPGTFNNENDLLKVEVTDDAQAFIIRITTAQCDFDIPIGYALVIFEITGPGGEDWDVSVAYDDGCANPRGIEVDSVLGDADVPMPGLRFDADAANNQLYIFSDYADNGMSSGDSVTFDRVHTGREFVGRYTFGMDELTLPAFKVGTGAALNTGAPATEVPEPTGPVVERLDLAGEHLAQGFANATSITYHYNWTLPAENGTFLLSAMPTQGSVNVTIHDAEGDALLLAPSASGNLSQGFENAPGPWNLTLVYDGFAGNLSLQWIAPDAPEAVAPSEPAPPTEADDVPDTSTGDGNNETVEDKAKESPGTPFALLAVTVGLVAWIRRR